MTNLDIVVQRLHNQHLSQPTFEKPEEVVQWTGVVQAQDFLYSLWAVGLRMIHATQADIEQAIAERSIVRTWPMRGTVHFVPSEDAACSGTCVTVEPDARAESGLGSGLGYQGQEQSRLTRHAADLRCALVQLAGIGRISLGSDWVFLNPRERVMPSVGPP